MTPSKEAEMPTPRRMRPLIPLVAALACAAGCAQLQRQNSRSWLTEPVRASNESAEAFAVKAALWYPLRDVVTLDPLARILLGDAAWNLNDDGGVDDSSFYTNRTNLPPPGDADANPWNIPPPEPPWTVVRVITSGPRPSFVGRDATGRDFHIKFDHPDNPELGTSAEVIGARLMYLLGYHVPPVFVVNVAGTEDKRFDGRRASASLYIDGDVRGHFPFDWFRYRREMRAAHLACCWLNDTDRAANNNLVVVREGRAYYYLIDFNSSLGSWSGLPKEPWQGRCYRSDGLWRYWRRLFPQAERDGYDPNQPVISPAVGRFHADFDPRTWRPNLPNTAFDHMTADDARWMADKMAALSETHIRAAVDAARFSDPADADYVLSTLLERRWRIVKAYGIDPRETASD
jgi:hypothetical protein